MGGAESEKMKCPKPTCYSIGPFGSRWVKQRKEFVPYKMCERCRNNNSKRYAKHGHKQRAKMATADSRTRQREVAHNPKNKEKKRVLTKVWKETDQGREVMLKLQEERKRQINVDPNLKLEQSITASIRGRLAGVRNSDSSINLSNFTEFSSTSDLTSHFNSKLKEGMTMDNYGEYWSVAHVIPKVYFDFSDDAEIFRCNSKSNLSCDYVKWPNPLHERTNSSKGGAMPTLSEIYSVSKECWPSIFGNEMTEEKRKLFARHRSMLE